MEPHVDTLFIYQAQGFWARFYGWHAFDQPGQLLFFPHCRSVHGLGLKKAIWVLFVDKQGKAIGSWRCLKPNGFMYCWQAYGVLERADMSKAQRRTLYAALKKTDLTRLIPWRLSCFAQKYYGK